MKRHLRLFIWLVLLLPLRLFAQSRFSDIVYLKNGSTYSGIIIQITPEANYKVELMGGTVIVVPIDSIKTVKFKGNSNYKIEYYPDTTGKILPYTPRSVYYHCPHRAFFVEGTVFAPLAVGLKVVFGYKFCRYGYLGLGVNTSKSLVSFPYDDHNTVLTSHSGYTSLLLSYSGTILNRRVSPFYNICAGYAFPISPSGGGFYVGRDNVISMKIHGGAAGSIGFGLIVYTRLVYLKWATECIVLAPKYSGIFNSSHQYRSTTSVIIDPVISLSIGFEK